MFKVEFFVDDRKLADALRGLAGLAQGQPTAVPVVNAEQASNGKLVAASDGSCTAQFLHFIAKERLATVNSQVAKAFLKSVGRSPLSASYILKHAVMAGALRKQGAGAKMSYAVLMGSPKKSKKAKPASKPAAAKE